MPGGGARLLPAKLVAMPGVALAATRLPRPGDHAHVRQAAALHGVLLRRLTGGGGLGGARVRGERGRPDAVPAGACVACGLARSGVARSPRATLDTQALPTRPAQIHPDRGASEPCCFGRALLPAHAADAKSIQRTLRSPHTRKGPHPCLLVLHAKFVASRRGGDAARGHVPPERRRSRLLRLAHLGVARAFCPLRQTHRLPRAPHPRWPRPTAAQRTHGVARCFARVEQRARLHG
mmetsp:Transcript_14549/g.36832  ORF Transcript_14549/g.36832 Transcript_14549/m.36832 type:complete len:236 (-) Transcript_14549:85-792(-)